MLRGDWWRFTLHAKAVAELKICGDLILKVPDVIGAWIHAGGQWISFWQGYRLICCTVRLYPEAVGSGGLFFFMQETLLVKLSVRFRSVTFQLEDTATSVGVVSPQSKGKVKPRVCTSTEESHPKETLNFVPTPRRKVALHRGFMIFEYESLLC